MHTDDDPDEVFLLGQRRGVLRLARSLTRAERRPYAIRRISSASLGQVADQASVLIGLRPGFAAPAALALGADTPREIMPLIGRRLADVERELLLGTLNFCHGNRTYAAQLLGISVRTMRNKLRALIDEGVPVIPPAPPVLNRVCL